MAVMIIMMMVQPMVWANMNFDSSFYNKLSELHNKKFDWKTNNCGLFVGEVLKLMYNRDFNHTFMSDYSDEKSAFDYIQNKGGWHSVLSSVGLKKRENDTICVGDVVICEKAIGIFDGNNALFAGGAFRRRNKITEAYYI